ncbi:acyl-CoA dehydrogenase family protein, partial [Bordetella petrii]|uniref:acyl-CoA dehydrogenase family protein n=1 Tax=Bordetella petrii TaxID=94624 RepID=UPI001E2EEE8C
MDDIADMMEDAGRRFLEQRHPVSRVRDPQSRGGHSGLWRELAGLEWPALLLPEEAGGMGQGLQAAWPLAYQAGRHLLTVPLVANMVLLPMLCKGQGDGGPLASWLAPVLSGDAYDAPAVIEPDGSLLVEYAAADRPALAPRYLASGKIRLERYSLAGAAVGAGLDPTLDT